MKITTREYSSPEEKAKDLLAKFESKEKALLCVEFALEDYAYVRTEGVPIYVVTWNDHDWVFTNDAEAWAFANYWGLL